MPFSFEKRKPNPQQQADTLTRKNTELEAQLQQQAHIIQTLTDALKSHGVLVTMANGTVTFSEPAPSIIANVPPRASARKQPLSKKTGQPHEG